MTLDVPGQMDLLADWKAEGQDLEREEFERRIAPFRGPLVPVAWDWSGGNVKRGDLVEYFRCPTCGGLAHNLYYLDNMHGWDPMWQPDVPPSSYDFYGVEMCQFQWSQMKFHAGWDAGRRPERLDGKWGHHAGVYQRIWTESGGYIDGYFATKDPLPPPATIWRQHVQLIPATKGGIGGGMPARWVADLLPEAYGK